MKIEKNLQENLLLEDFQRVCSSEEISLYFHFPFCAKKCPYCHFFVVEQKKESKNDRGQENFLESLLRDLEQHKNIFSQKKLRSIYFGGGTPSLFAPGLFKILLDRLREHFVFSPSLEITLEANPESLSAASLEAFQNSGINRLSLGLQSLDDQELLQLGRGHKGRTALWALEILEESGIPSYSVDLMLETPGQTMQSLEKTLERICQRPPPHLSVYNLVIEPNTPFARREKTLRKRMVDNQQATEMLLRADSLFAQAGLERYEISAFSKKGHESCHNTGYWRGRSFLGLGPSAFSFLDGVRLQKRADLLLWTEDPSIWEVVDDPGPVVRQAELLALHLRLRAGLQIASFESRWGQLTEALRNSLKDLEESGWIRSEDRSIRLTQEGRLFYERMATTLMP